MKHRLRAVAALALLLVLLPGLAGCASRSAPAAGSTASTTPAPTRSAPAPSTAPIGQPAALKIVRGGSPAIAGPRWTAIAVSASGRSVTIEWADAVAASCGAVDTAVVTESATAVVVALGRHARAPHRLCPLVLALRRAVIPLTQPLGGRALQEPVASGLQNLPVPRSTCPARPGVDGTRAEGAVAGVRPAIACPLTPGGA